MLAVVVSQVAVFRSAFCFCSLQCSVS